MDKVYILKPKRDHPEKESHDKDPIKAAISKNRLKASLVIIYLLIAGLGCWKLLSGRFQPTSNKIAAWQNGVCALGQNRPRGKKDRTHSRQDFDEKHFESSHVHVFNPECTKLIPNWRGLAKLPLPPGKKATYANCTSFKGYMVPDQVDQKSLLFFNEGSYFLNNFIDDEGSHDLSISIILTIPFISYELASSQGNKPAYFTFGWQVQFSWTFPATINPKTAMENFLACAELHVIHRLKLPLKVTKPTDINVDFFTIEGGTSREIELLKAFLGLQCHKFVELRDLTEGMLFSPNSSVMVELPSLQFEKMKEMNFVEIFQMVMSLDSLKIIDNHQHQNQTFSPMNNVLRPKYAKEDVFSDVFINVVTPYDLVPHIEDNDTSFVEIRYDKSTVYALLTVPLPELFFVGKPIRWLALPEGLMVTRVCRQKTLYVMQDEYGNLIILADGEEKRLPPSAQALFKSRIAIAFKGFGTRQILRVSKDEYALLYL